MVSDGVVEHSAATGALPHSVIVVEDDLLIARNVSDLVSRLGVRVLGMAPNGEKALQSINGEKPAAAIVDVRMPGIDGIETARRLWEDHRIPSIMLTAYGAEEFVNRAIGVPVFGYVIKPATEESLRASLSVGWVSAQKHIDCNAEVADLRRTLDHRKVTEKAKWRLVGEANMTEPEAHLALQRAARAARKPLTQVAQRVIDAETTEAAMRVLSQ